MRVSPADCSKQSGVKTVSSVVAALLGVGGRGSGEQPASRRIHLDARVNTSSILHCPQHSPEMADGRITPRTNHPHQAFDRSMSCVA